MAHGTASVCQRVHLAYRQVLSPVVHVPLHAPGTPRQHNSLTGLQLIVQSVEYAHTEHACPAGLGWGHTDEVTSLCERNDASLAAWEGH